MNILNYIGEFFHCVMVDQYILESVLVKIISYHICQYRQASLCFWNAPTPKIGAKPYINNRSKSPVQYMLHQVESKVIQSFIQPVHEE